MDQLQIQWAKAQPWFLDTDGSTVTVVDWVLDSKSGIYEPWPKKFTNYESLLDWACRNS